MSHYKKLTKEITELDAQILSNRSRRSEAMDRVGDNNKAIVEVDIALRKALLDGDHKAATALEKKVEERSQSLARDEMLAGELDKILPALQEQRASMQKAANKEFAQNASKILADEVKQHDVHARGVIESTKRLLATYDLVREIGHSEVYRGAVGDAFEFIPVTSVPLIAQFNRSAYASGEKFRVTNKLKDETRKLIEAV